MAPSSKRAPASESSGSDDDETSSNASSDDDQLDQQQNGDEEPIPEINVDVSKLNPLSPEVIEKQATINIGQACSLPSTVLAARLAGQEIGYLWADSQLYMYLQVPLDT
jgi:hypothetical protein